MEILITVLIVLVLLALVLLALLVKANSAGRRDIAGQNASITLLQQQLEFKNWVGGIPQAVNNQSGGVTTDVSAAYTMNGGTITIEIETRIWQSWQMGENPGWGFTNVDLVNRGDVRLLEEKTRL